MYIILYYIYISTITDLSLPRKFVEASADPSGRLMRVLFSEYLECSENWLASQLVLNETSSQNDVTGGKFSWMTRAETHRVKIQFFDGAENSEHNFFPIILFTEPSLNYFVRAWWTWHTLAQSQDLMVRYHQNGAIVQELINGKVVSGQCKDHPEFPGNAEA